MIQVTNGNGQWNVLELHSKDILFEYQPEYWLSGLRFSWISSAPPVKCRHNTWISLGQLASQFLPIHLPSSILPFFAIESGYYQRCKNPIHPATKQYFFSAAPGKSFMASWITVAPTAESIASNSRIALDTINLVVSNKKVHGGDCGSHFLVIY